MSCFDCEASQDGGSIAYLRVGKANVGITGCDKHVGQVIDTVNFVRAEGIEVPVSGRQIVRVINQNDQN